jgi:hypothetical protein
MLAQYQTATRGGTGKNVGLTRFRFRNPKLDAFK